jgi:DNA-binding NarL/FixJ family response regulator
MSSPEKRPEPVNILLAEDDLFFSVRILSVLDKLGYLTDTAKTQDEAVRKAAENRPALVIINLASKRVGGAELIRRLKAKEPAPRVVAYLSHTRIPEVRNEVLAAGADKICANSAITMRLPQIVQQVLSDDAGPTVDDDE